MQACWMFIEHSTHCLTFTLMTYLSELISHKSKRDASAAVRESDMQEARPTEPEEPDLSSMVMVKLPCNHENVSCNYARPSTLVSNMNVDTDTGSCQRFWTRRSRISSGQR